MPKLDLRGIGSADLAIPPQLYQSFRHAPSLDFQLPARETNIGQLLHEVEPVLFRRPHDFTRRLLGADVWGSNASLKNLYESHHSAYEPITGALNLRWSSDVKAPALVEFFEHSDRTHVMHGKTYNRGPSYYVAASNLPTTEIVLTMLRDVTEGLEALQNVRQRSLSAQGLPYVLGVLDYLKVHSLTLFNALTFPEREGILSQDADYNFCKFSMLKLARQATHSYYLAMLGRNYPLAEQNNRINFLEDFTLCSFLVEDRIKAGITERRHFKVQEVDHPLVLGLHAHENAMRFCESEVIIGLPFGGLQSAIVTEMAFDLVHGRRPSLVLLPLSLHGGVERAEQRVSDADLMKVLMGGDIKGKNVLVTEDNSNTGRTLAKISRLLSQCQASDIKCTVAELDVKRIVLKQTKEPPEQAVANICHPDFSTAVRAVPISRQSTNEKIGTQIVKNHAVRVASRLVYDGIS